jgi:hypothetical protein
VVTQGEILGTNGPEPGPIGVRSAWRASEWIMRASPRSFAPALLLMTMTVQSCSGGNPRSSSSTATDPPRDEQAEESSGQAQPCAGLDDNSRKAFYYMIDSAYGIGKVGSEDAEELLWANKILAAEGKAVLPCLIDIYSHGVKGALWHGERPEPPSGRWALGLIRSIDGPSAIPLYRDLYAGARDPMTRVVYASELVSLGELAHVTEVMSFLTAPPRQTSAGGTSVGRARQDALAAIAAQNYKPALPALRMLAEDDTVGDRHVLAVYIAQLSGDVDTVKAAVSDESLRDKALVALKRMGKDDVLRKVAEDRSNPAVTREAARLALAGKLAI